MERAAATEYLRDQYATPEKLDIRIQAHQRYSERPDDYLDWVLNHLDPRPGESVVDVGCGRGSYHMPLVKRGVRVILALDTSPGMVSTSQQQAIAHGLPVVAIEASAERIPVTDASYDLGMANHVLFHVADVAAALRELRRVLKDGGRAVLTTAGADSAARLESLHCDAARRLGYQPAGRVIERFNMDHLDLVRSVFPTTQRYIRDDAFVFPSTELTLRYYASGMIDAIENRPVDNGHREPLMRLVGEAVDAIIAREGVFRDPKPAGCFVVTKS
ncbi:MAG TPA: class I SAM-dependent methyltransferase [Chloroflexota bacterium]